MTGPLALDIEDRLFRRGVSDQELRQAIELVREYIEGHRLALQAAGDGWREFGDFYEELTRNLSLPQVAAFEIAIETLMVDAGVPRWSDMRGAGPVTPEPGGALR
jgi:hypothetical protein